MYSVSFQSEHHLKYQKTMEKSILCLLSCLHYPPCHIDISLCSDADFIVYNKELRGREKIEDLLPIRYPASTSPRIGLIIVNLEQVQREFIHKPEDIPVHLDGLLTHGLLHVLGYDHMDRKEGREWEDLQNTLQSALQDTTLNTPILE